MDKPYHFVKFYRDHDYNKPGVKLHFKWLVRFERPIEDGKDADRLAKMVTADVERIMRRYERKYCIAN